MTEVGVRELRDHLSRYLEQVQAGAEVVVTERGRAIARVVPLSGERTIDTLIRQGLVTPARRRQRGRPTPLDSCGTVSDLVAEQRR
jgi:prevent-host-death family protein